MVIPASEGEDDGWLAAHAPMMAAAEDGLSLVVGGAKGEEVSLVQGGLIDVGPKAHRARRASPMPVFRGSTGEILSARSPAERAPKKALRTRSSSGGGPDATSVTAGGRAGELWGC